jgi:hypothetical protein
MREIKNIGYTKFLSDNLKGRNHWEDLDIGGRIVLK